MLVLDSPTQEKWKAIRTVDRTRELTSHAYAHNLAANSYLMSDDNGIDVTDANGQLGEVMHVSEFKRRLLSIHRNFIFETSNNYPELCGAYLPVFSKTEQKQIKQFIVGMTNGWMPEFSVRHFKTERIPKNGEWEIRKTFARETRGWRTVLVKLLQGSYISIGDIEREFPSIKRQSRLWNQATTL